MNWLSKLVRPKFGALVKSKEVPENLWLKCPSCDTMLFQRDLAENHHVCPQCGYHNRLTAEQRLGMLFDHGEYQKIQLPAVPADPLKFRDNKRYTDRLKDAQSKVEATPNRDALVVGHGTLGGQKTVIAAFDFRFMGGSMGMAVGEGLLAAAHLAVLQKAPLIVVPASGGARMQEGILSLMQMPRTIIAVNQVREAGLPYIVVLTDPTTGGVTASFAMVGDVHIAETGAQIGFAGTRVIEETIRETLPEGFQRAEYLKDHGMVDIVVHRRDLRPTLIRICDLLVNQRPPADVVPLTPDAVVDAEFSEPLAEEASEETETDTAPEQDAETDVAPEAEEDRTSATPQ